MTLTSPFALFVFTLPSIFAFCSYFHAIFVTCAYKDNAFFNFGISSVTNTSISRLFFFNSFLFLFKISLVSSNVCASRSICDQYRSASRFSSSTFRNRSDRAAEDKRLLVFRSAFCTRFVISRMTSDMCCSLLFDTDFISVYSEDIKRICCTSSSVCWYRWMKSCTISKHSFKSMLFSSSSSFPKFSSSRRKEYSSRRDFSVCIETDDMLFSRDDFKSLRGEKS
mmetsp:Transcript_5163/g.17558  ORF Transcript_5163/g.17558 Transcript_5163/m.17558 type:complete len:224 (-) Transcript_5163:200-871(-)